MTAKFSTTSLYNESDFVGFELCERTTTVNYDDIKRKAREVFGSDVLAIAVAVKCNLRGMKIKPDDFFKVAGKTVPMSAMMAKLHAQEGYGEEASRNKTLGKESKKDLVSLGRNARAFAKETTQLIKKGTVKVEADVAKMAAEVGLPAEYAFLAAPWGMTDDEVKKHGEELYLFAQSFDNMISAAHMKGWCQGANKRSHGDTLVSYLTFRGLQIGGAGS
jgi:hypothetical protein